MHCNPVDECGCAACAEGAFDVQPNHLIMALRFLAFGAGALVALVGLIKGGRKKELLAWLGGWGLFLTLPRYLICASCTGYGKMCYSYYLGKYTSMILPKREKPVPLYGLGLEGLALSTIFWAPAIGLRKDRKSLMAYLAMMQLVLVGQFLHACRYCGTHSDDEFKKFCPNHQFWRKFR
jgi:hypothetical protein